MKIIQNYVKTFNKVIFLEKIPFVYTLLFPTIIFWWTNYSKIISRHDLDYAVMLSANYIAYIVVATAMNGILLQLINFREIGFLKTYTMISGGDRRYAVWGLIISELIFGYICTLIFSIPIILLNLASLIKVWAGYTLVYILSAIPVFIFSVVGSLLPMRTNTSNVVMNFLLFAMLWLSASRVDSHALFSEIVWGINPCDYVTQVFYVIENGILKAGSVYGYQIVAILVILLVFVGIGLYSVPRVPINSVNMRN